MSWPIDIMLGLGDGAHRHFLDEAESSCENSELSPASPGDDSNANQVSNRSWV